MCIHYVMGCSNATSEIQQLSFIIYIRDRCKTAIILNRKTCYGNGTWTVFESITVQFSNPIRGTHLHHTCNEK